MRTYGRITNQDGSKTWVQVNTDANGNNDYVWITTLCQCLKLNLGESPFYAQYGIPAQQSVLQQIYPDFYVNQTQSQFAQYFASLQITRRAALSRLDPTPIYDVSVLTNYGTTVEASIPT